MIASWPCPDGHDEYALSFDQGRKYRVLILPALFDESNKTRHLTVEVMRRLDSSGIDCFLPDLPGCNESPAPMDRQTLESWRTAAMAASKHFNANRVLTVRAAAILAPPDLTGWRYAPTGGANALRSLLRARVISAREAGHNESTESLTQLGRREGLELAGYRLSSSMFAELEGARVADSGKLSDISQSAIGGGGMWLRAEPDFDPVQADALAAIIAVGAAQ